MHGSYAQVFRHVSGRVDAQKEVVKERVGEDRCNVQVLCFQSCSVCRYILVQFPAPLDNMVQCDVTIARGNCQPSRNGVDGFLKVHKNHSHISALSDLVPMVA